jgi:hypothetical protein
MLRISLDEPDDDLPPNSLPNGAVPKSGEHELRTRIEGCLGRHVREVEIDLAGERMVVRGVSSTWHDRQMAQHAVLKEVTGPIEFAIRVGG